LTFISGWIYSNGLIFIGGFVMLVAALGDMLDGPLARITGQTSRFGAFLDSTVDRYSDFFLFGGLILYFAGEGELGWVTILLGIIAGSFVTSYTKARSENLIEKCSVGIFERAERILILAAGSLIPPLLPIALWVLFIGTNFTAIQRILFTRKALAEK
jgi:CDP-diacylglycerol--glycerol-3-phosphate 3-phosphatidyltransferase